jgi:hypothetical protein
MEFFITVGTKLKVARETAITSAQKAYNTHPQCIVSAHTSTQPQRFAAHKQSTTQQFTARGGRKCSSLALTSWSPTGILTENLAGLEPLASSATAADALAATCLYAGALLRTPARARDACEGGVERRRWCCCCGAAGSGFTEVLPSIYFVCILSEPSIGDGRPKTGLGPSV